LETALASTQPLPLGILLWIATLLAIVGSFLAAARLVYRRWRGLGIGLLWTGAVTLYAYGSFRLECSRPVTCDVGPDPFSMHYLVTVAPSYAIVAGIAFGLIALLTVLQLRRTGTVQSIGATIGTLIAGLLGWAGARFLVFAV
jgi:hypothetical protein